MEVRFHFLSHKSDRVSRGFWPTTARVPLDSSQPAANTKHFFEFHAAIPAILTQQDRLGRAVDRKSCLLTFLGSEAEIAAHCRGGEKRNGIVIRTKQI
jgi:hypothetical protein